MENGPGHAARIAGEALRTARDALYEAEYWVDDLQTAEDAAVLVLTTFLRALPGNDGVPLYSAIKDAIRESQPLR